MHALDQIGILGTGFLTTLVALFLAVVVAAVLIGRRHHWMRWCGALLSVVVALGFVAASINDHYAYLPNLGSLWGWRAVDQASWAAVRSPAAARLDRSVQVRRHGAVVEVVIPGVVSGFHGRPAVVYLPPAWFLRPKPALPVVELLHGSPGGPRDWTRAAAVDVTSDRYAAFHRGQAPIIVSPDINGSFDGDSECTDGTAGNVETYLTVDVPHWVDASLAPSRLSRDWAIGGLSEGGTCAMSLSLRHPAQFPTFLDFGGDERITHHGGAIVLFRGTPVERLRAAESYDPVLLLRRVRRPGRLHGWFEVGTRDSGSAALERLYGRAVRLGMHAHLQLTVGGQHTFRVWKRAFADSLPWLGEQFRIEGDHRVAPRPSNEPADVSLATGAATGIGPSPLP